MKNVKNILGFFIITFVFTLTVACSGADTDEGGDINTSGNGNSGNIGYGWYGNGSSNNFTIRNITQLEELDKIVRGRTGSGGPAQSDFKGKTITLAADIIMSGKTWDGIGRESYSQPFNGIFDGNNKTISGLHMEDLGASFFMLIGEDGILKNLVFADLSVSRYGGSGIVNTNKGLIQNIRIINANMNPTFIADVGGITSANYGIVENCYFSGNISSNGYGGGIAASNMAGGIIRNCYVTGDLSYYYGGGVVGINNGTVINCYTTCNFTGSLNGNGGIVGSNNGIVQNCYATGSITGNWYVGGISGDNRNGGMVKNCVALNSSIKCSTINNYILGRIGDNYSTTSFTNNYGLIGMIMRSGYTIVPDINGPDGADVSTEEIANQNWWITYIDWDFNTVWQWDTARNLPKLR
ncbi:MAG: hypothetical protein FWB86_03970 [Treponema sp.]|nr:hypothetical protein [Treponema sp.]MCL2272724.1 hypothetical protein [Treponema sp.]